MHLWQTFCQAGHVERPFGCIGLPQPGHCFFGSVGLLGLNDDGDLTDATSDDDGDWTDAMSGGAEWFPNGDLN